MGGRVAILGDRIFAETLQISGAIADALVLRMTQPRRTGQALHRSIASAA